MLTVCLWDLWSWALWIKLAWGRRARCFLHCQRRGLLTWAIHNDNSCQTTIISYIKKAQSAFSKSGLDAYMKCTYRYFILAFAHHTLSNLILLSLLQNLKNLENVSVVKKSLCRPRYVVVLQDYMNVQRGMSILKTVKSITWRHDTFTLPEVLHHNHTVAFNVWLFAYTVIQAGLFSLLALSRFKSKWACLVAVR